jgi:hypothetical protein
MNIDLWIPYLKFDNDGVMRCMAQQTYEPLINPEGTIFCANFDWQNRYQRMNEARPLYTQEVADFFFNEEVKNILKFKDKPYASEIIDIDYKLKRLYFKWYKESCNEVIYSGRALDTYCDDWRKQIKNIIIDLYKEKTYKLTIYPHCHYIDEYGQMRAIDWYGCVPVSDPFIEAKYMDAIIHSTAQFRLDETGGPVNNRYNLELMFKGSLKNHVMWGDESMEYIYKEIFND